MQKNTFGSKGWLHLILVLVAGSCSGYVMYYSIANLSQNYIDALNKLASIASDFDSIKEERDGFKKLLDEEKETNESLRKKVDKITKKADKLQKIKDTDKELLQKYSKVYFLNENYVPKELSKVDKKYIFPETRTIELHSEVVPFMEDMIDDAEDEGLHLRIISGYRSFTEQKSLKGSYTVTYGTTAANKFSADQGYSEHQLGTAMDLTTSTLGNGYTAFQKTKEYEWLNTNAYRYGFVLSYPPNNTYYVFEPWHWRFVGKTLAEKLHDENKYFYDLDQREIDDYILDLFEQ